jgi:hypothetical protein
MSTHPKVEIEKPRFGGVFLLTGIETSPARQMNWHTKRNGAESTDAESTVVGDSELKL